MGVPRKKIETFREHEEEKEPKDPATQEGVPQEEMSSSWTAFPNTAQLHF
jgi:hypothetical protein